VEERIDEIRKKYENGIPEAAVEGAADGIIDRAETEKGLGEVFAEMEKEEKWKSVLAERNAKEIDVIDSLMKVYGFPETYKTSTGTELPYSISERVMFALKELAGLRAVKGNAVSTTFA
jgi:hypothetical protein